MVIRSLIHPDGPGFSRIIAGMWRLSEWNYTTSQTIEWVEKCLEMGVTTFDHADIYGDYTCESMFGNVLAERPDFREKMQLVTKCGICLVSDKQPDYHVKHYNTSSEHIMQSAEQSLKNLKTDILDLLLIHRPSPLMDVDDMAEGMMNLVNSGKVKHLGVSNFTPSQFDLLQSRLDVPLVTNQVECSVLHPEPIYDGTFDQAHLRRARPMIWSPLGGGDLFTSKNSRPKRVRKALKKLSKKTGYEIDQLALSWLLHLPSRPFLILGTGKTDRIQNAVDILSFDMNTQDWFALLEASHGFEVP